MEGQDEVLRPRDHQQQPGRDHRPPRSPPKTGDPSEECSDSLAGDDEGPGARPVHRMLRDIWAEHEDGARQQILTFAFEHIGKDAVPISGASVLAGAAAAGRTPPPFVPAAGDTSSAPAGVVPSHPLSSDEVAGHRLLTLLFDTSSMQPEDVQKAVDGAVKWVDGQMTPALPGKVLRGQGWTGKH